MSCVIFFIWYDTRFESTIIDTRTNQYSSVEKQGTYVYVQCPWNRLLAYGTIDYIDECFLDSDDEDSDDEDPKYIASILK